MKNENEMVINQEWKLDDGTVRHQKTTVDLYEFAHIIYNEQDSLQSVAIDLNQTKVLLGLMYGSMLEMRIKGTNIPAWHQISSFIDRTPDLIKVLHDLQTGLECSTENFE